MIQAFDERYEITSPDEEVVEALRGCREKQRTNEKILQTLGEAPVPVYYLKEWQEPWDGRFSSDIDIAVRTEDLQTLHEFLTERNFFARPEEYIPPTPLLRAEQGISRRLQSLKELLFLERQDYTMARLIRMVDETVIFDEIEDVESDMLDPEDVNKIHRFLSRRRRHLDKTEDLRSLHRLMMSRLQEKTDTEREETRVEDVNNRLEDVVELRKLKGSIGLPYNRSDRFVQERSGEFEYTRGAQFLEVLKLDETEASDGKPLEVDEDEIRPEDNFVLHASHFCKNITNIFSEHHFTGFLKCLIDGAVLFKRRNLSVQKIMKRSKSLNRTDETAYYLHLLQKHDFVDVNDVTSHTLYDLVDDETLLFNERTLQTKIVALMILAYWLMKGKQIEHKEPPWVS
jgi:hypothetical protein